MPVRSYETKLDFDRDYSSPYWTIEDPIGSGQLVKAAIIKNPDGSYPEQGYWARDFGSRIGKDNGDFLISNLGLQQNQTILIVGAGFGWSVEYLEGLGYGLVLGIDTSTYIQTNKDIDDFVDLNLSITNLSIPDRNRLLEHSYTSGSRVRATRGILNESGSNGSSRNTIKAALGLTGNQKIDIAISELVIDTATDSEASDISGAMRAMSTRVVHYIRAFEDYNPSDPDWNKKTLSDWKTLLSSGDEFLDSRGRQL